jgi:N-methylhydantoinase A
VRLTRLLDLRYPHQGYTLGVECPATLASDDDKTAVKRAFDELHGRVYGQSAPREDAEIVTFRLQAEIEVPRLELKRLEPGDGNSARALTGERPLFDLDTDRFVAARIYDRAKLMPGDRVQGPAIIDQFDATTMVLGGQAATVDPHGILVIENDEN